MTQCMLCLNPYELEEVTMMGTCGHIYPSLCIINFLVYKMFCPKCPLPIHQRFYELHGILKYIPISHEYNAFTLPLDCPHFIGAIIVDGIGQSL